MPSNPYENHTRDELLAEIAVLRSTLKLTIRELLTPYQRSALVHYLETEILTLPALRVYPGAVRSNRARQGIVDLMEECRGSGA